jgi:hypothetical protein
MPEGNGRSKRNGVVEGFGGLPERRDGVGDEGVGLKRPATL